MPKPTFSVSSVLITLWLAFFYTFPVLASKHSSPPPANDHCTDAMPITISGGGYDYGTFNSLVSDMTTATGQSGEFFEFVNDYGHTKSVWFEFTLNTSRRITIQLETAPGSSLPDPKQSGVTLYAPASCLPASSDRLGSIISSGQLERFCTTAGTYRIQVTAVANVTASFMVRLTIDCPFDPIYPEVSIYDCPDKAYEFNSGQPLPQASSQYTQLHAIDCHSIEDPSEYACLPVANKNEFLKSSWYVFTTGNLVDFLAFDFPVSIFSDQVGYRLLEGNVRSQPLSSLPLIDCGMAYENATIRYIEFPCILKANTTYSLALLFHKDFVFNDLNVRALQRGMSPTGWPMPVLPPASAANQLGILPMVLSWDDRFDCSSFISNNVCPPANPVSGAVTISNGGFNKILDMSTWATFTLATDANVKFDYTFSHANGEYYTRIFKRTLNATCPSPDPSGSDLYYAFDGKKGEVKCLPQGDYSIQVLASSNDTFPSVLFHKDSWSNGYLGTRFSLKFTIAPLPSIGLFRLDATDSVDLINNLSPMVNNVMYPGTPAVFICPNTVLPDQLACLNVEKAIYREVNIGDYDADGNPDEGLLCISTLRTDTLQGKPITYQLFKGDANQLSTAANTHAAGEFIPGLTDYAGICIDQTDYSINPPGIDNFCACVTAGTYTLASYGDVDNVGKGDAPGFKLIVSKTIHDSPLNAEVINVGSVPGNYPSDPDAFSCNNNPGNVPPCGDSKKLVYREFYLSDTFVVNIKEIGTTTSFMSLFKGRATDLTALSAAILECFSEHLFTDPCTPLEPGWYTLISYGYGPDYATPIYDVIGDRLSVGRNTRVNIELQMPITPLFNRPYKAYQAGITDWVDRPLGNPNAITAKTYGFATETFCLPDTPFIADSLAPCGLGYNRVAFYVFEITKPSFIQIRNVDASFFTAVFPFDVDAQPGDLLLIPAVYPCVSTSLDTRQICDLPPGKYTLAIFANDSHFGMTVKPSIYVEEAELSRFDHAWEAYDFDVIPTTNVFVDGRPLDTNPTWPGQAPSRDVFYCTTGADPQDPADTQCGTQLNDLVYAQPAGVPKPLFLPNNPPPPVRQPWRNLWYTFKLSGSGICTLHVEALNGLNYKPLVALYESDVDGNIPWAVLQSSMQSPNDTIISKLKLIKEKVKADCDAETGDIMFNKSGCIKDYSRYYVVISFDAFEVNNFPPNLPNQAVSVSVKYDAKPTYGAPYDETSTANVINGLGEASAPYTSVPLMQGNTFTSVDFSLLCYTKNSTDPPGCMPTQSGKSAWFKFEIGTHGQLLLALEKIGVPNGWVASDDDISVWRDNGTGPPLTDEFPLNPFLSGHEWLGACFDPGAYYLLVRHCSAKIDTIQGYRVVLTLVDSPGDFCSNAIPVDVLNFTPVTESVIVNCHTIGTDVGEIPLLGNTCFSIVKQKTSWFKVHVAAGPMVDLKFQLGENFTSPLMDLSDVNYRILAGTCGAMTPIACSEGNINLTLNCLGPGDYYVQVVMPTKINGGPASADVEGTLSLTVTATPSNQQTCTTPLDPFEITANFIYDADCQSISFFNQSTAGMDIAYHWEFPDGTSTDANPIWTPTAGAGPYSITLIVTNIVLQTSDTFTLMVALDDPFASYAPLNDQLLCNQETVLLDATYSNASYLWDDNSTKPIRSIHDGGIYWVLLTIDGCTRLDSVIVNEIHAEEDIKQTLCSGESILIHGQLFDESHSNGIITLPGADPSGCDSLLSVQLAFLAPVFYQFSDTICSGESFAFANQNLTQTGIYYDTLISAIGCDSIITLTLSVTPRQQFNRAVSDCVGNPVLLMPVIGGVTYEWSTGSDSDSILVDVAGTYVVSVSDATDCIISEETFTVTFGVLASPVVSIPLPACAGEDVMLSAIGSSGNYLWFNAASGGQLLGSGSSIALSNVQSNTTIYVQAFLVGLDTCWSERVPIPIDVIPENVNVVEMDTVVCEGASVELPWGEIVQPAASDSFMYVWPSALTGCDSLSLTVQVHVLDMQSIVLPLQLTLQLGDSIRLEPVFDFVADSLIWMPPDGLSCVDCPEPWAQPLKTIDYLLSVWSKEGCLITAPIQIKVKRDLTLYIPNVFSPNGDGNNDLFSIYSKRGVGLVHQFNIYDRWGEAIWEYKDFLADGSVGWDGTFHGKPMPSGVFVWTCEVELADGSIERLKGDLILVR